MLTKRLYFGKSAVNPVHRAKGAVSKSERILKKKGVWECWWRLFGGKVRSRDSDRICRPRKRTQASSWILMPHFLQSIQHRALLLIWSESHLTENRSVETQCQIETPFICNRKIIQIKVGIVQKSANRKQKQVELIWGMKESTEAKSEKNSTVRAPN